MISVQDLECSYGRKIVVNKANLEVAKGECIGIVGANGCGKSTLLSALAGVKKIKKGSICLDGRNPQKDKKLFTELIGYVPQENPLVPELNVRDNLRLWYSGSRNLEEELQVGFLKVLEIDSFLKTPVSRLSGGMKRRLSLACAAAGNPPILILDEPGTAIDMVCKQSINDYLRAFLKEGGTVILTSHEEGELALCNWLYVMKEGKLSQADAGLRGHELLKLF